MPYGYRVGGKDWDARLRVVHEVDALTAMAEANVVRMMFSWSANDELSSVQIAQCLNPTALKVKEALDVGVS